MSAEFAVVLPAVLIVLSLVIGGVLLASHRVVLTSAAADIVRLEARGDVSLAQQRASELGGGIALSREHRGGLLCVRLKSSPGSGLLANIGVSVSACAARIEETVEGGT